MTIAVTASGKTIDDQMDPRFGRCGYFLLIDPETMTVTPLANPSQSMGGGAGIQAAQLMAERGVKAVLTGNCGPNAYRTLEAAGIEVIVGLSGRVRQAVENYRAGALAATQKPSVDSHHGRNSGANAGNS